MILRALVFGVASGYVAATVMGRLSWRPGSEVNDGRLPV